MALEEGRMGMMAQRTIASELAGSDPRTARILAKAIYKEARGAGMAEPVMIAVATELLGLVAEEMKAARE